MPRSARLRDASGKTLLGLDELIAELAREARIWRTRRRLARAARLLAPAAALAAVAALLS